jgi:hypothetical protein
LINLGKFIGDFSIENLIFPKLVDLKHEDQYINFIAKNDSTARFIGLDIKELDHDPLYEFIFDIN